MQLLIVYSLLFQIYIDVYIAFTYTKVSNSLSGVFFFTYKRVSYIVDPSPPLLKEDKVSKNWQKGEESGSEIFYRNGELVIRREFSKREGMPNLFYRSEYSGYNGSK